CNLLNAIGGKPDLTKPGFLPDYPSPLPGTIEEGLIVPIKSFSMDLVRDIFLRIEEPDHQIIPVIPPIPAGAFSIGTFYRRIQSQLDVFGDSIFTGAKNLQVDFPFDFLETTITSSKITNKEEAKLAIDEIVGQGEG